MAISLPLYYSSRVPATNVAHTHTHSCMHAGIHASTRVGRPFAAMWALTSSMPTSRRWKMPAASAAAALVRLKTCMGAEADAA